MEGASARSSSQERPGPRCPEHGYREGALGTVLDTALASRP